MMADSDCSGRLKPLARACNDEAQATPAGAQPIPAASGAIQNQEGSPMFHAYRVEIPIGWRALQPVFYPVRGALAEPARPDIPAALLKGWQQFRVGVLLSRLGTDDLKALQEFEADISLEAAFLGQDGQYLQSAQTRPVYALLPLAAPSSVSLDQSPRAECLVLLPLINPSPWSQESLPPMMMFVDGVCLFKEAA